MFFSIGGYMSGNFLHGFIPSCIGLYLLYPLLKLKLDLKKDKDGKYSILFAFLILIISVNVESDGLSFFLFCFAGLLVYSSFKRIFTQNYKKF